MEIVNYTKEEFSKLNKLKLSKDIISIESQLYIINKNNNPQVIKKFKNDSPEFMANKIITLEDLYNNQDIQNMDELIKQNKLFSVDNIIVGSIMDYIENINLIEILYDSNIDYKIKVNYIKQIGYIIEKVNKLNNFFLNDIHEANYIIDKNGRLRVVDTDSMKTPNNKPICPKFLSVNNNLLDVSLMKKYQIKDITTVNPNYNTEIFSYIYIILNFISNNKSFYLVKTSEFFDYLQYLIDIGFNKEFIDLISNI